MKKVRGKTKILTMALIVSMLSMIFAATPAFAAGNLSLPTVENPLYGPGTPFSIDMTAGGFGKTQLLKSFEFKIKYDADILTATGIVPNKARPEALRNVLYESIDNTAGVITFGVEFVPYAGSLPGVNASYTILVAVLSFAVVARGTSGIDLADVVIKDTSDVIQPVIVNSGSFDNRLQGVMSAPHIVNTSLVNLGDEFDVYVSISPWEHVPVNKLWGFQFVMSYDPNIIMAVEFSITAVNDEGIAFMVGPSELGADYAAITGNSYFGDPVGLTIHTATPVARIHFVVLAVGATVLDLHDTVMANVDGSSLVHEVEDGSFANVNVVVQLNAIFVESRKWSLSGNGNMFTLTEQFQNAGNAPAMARAHFKVYDSLGVVIADITTDAVNTMPGTTVRVSAQLDLSGFDVPGSYVVEGTVEYYSAFGTWVTGTKGSGDKTTSVKTFTLLP